MACTTGVDDWTPEGVPTFYDWERGSRPSWPGSFNDGVQGLTPWLQVYPAQGDPAVTHAVQVEVANMRAWTHVAGGAWARLASDMDPQVGAYSEDFTSSTDQPFVTVTVQPYGAVESISMIAGHNIHGWMHGWPRPTIPNGFDAVLVAVDARLVNDPSKSGLLPYTTAEIELGVGCDIYSTSTSTLPGDTGHGDLGQPAMRKVLPDQWQTFYFLSCSMETHPADFLLASPAPLNA